MAPKAWQAGWLMSGANTNAPPSRGTLLRRLDALIALLDNEYTRLVSEPQYLILVGELHRYRDGARYILADAAGLGFRVGTLQQGISQLKFDPDANPQIQNRTLEKFVDLLKTARKRLEYPNSSPARLRSKLKPFPTPQSADWPMVSIRLLSDERVQITVGSTTETRNFAEMGCEDRRSQRPDQIWRFVRHLAEHNGLIQNPGDAGVRHWSVAEKRVQTLRTRLRQLFGISSDPFEPFHKVNGYKAIFRTERARSYDS